jgi:clan AA aspartic protease (TIGR02281 family)
MAAVLLAGGGFFLFKVYLAPHFIEKGSKFPGAYSTKTLADKSSASPNTTYSIPITSRGRIEINVGTVVLRDITGSINAELPVPIINGGWVALPKQMCIGASSWELRLAGGKRLEIVGGIVQNRDDIAIWRIQAGLYIDGPALHPWVAAEPAAWISLTTGKTHKSVILDEYDVQQNYIKHDLPDDVHEPGLYVQSGRVVGWTFGNYAAAGYLWRGPEGERLQNTVRVEEFYRLTFAGGREEGFAIALAEDDNLAREKLEAFVYALRLQPKLSEPDTPSRYKTAAIIPVMRLLMSELEGEGRTREVADLFDAQVLIDAGSMALIMDVVRLTQASYGYEYAVALLEEVRNYLVPPNNNQLTQLEKYHADLYKTWLGELIQRDDLTGAQQVLNQSGVYFPDDPRFHLLGVQIALEDRGWSAAEEFLHMRSYPPDMMDQVKNLQDHIAALKGEQGRIVLRFVPGSRQIPVEAVLNNTIRQRFIVDTGASMVTIPIATATELGIEPDSRYPLRKVYTAGGQREAREVVLSVVEIGSWASTDVKALVLDLPNQPDVGLLGLNYLRRFRLDLNTEKGTLILEPR